MRNGTGGGGRARSRQDAEMLDASAKENKKKINPRATMIV
jgi:hypothetical protein